ncbi:MAG: hypothetical protein IPF54_24375 [Draconibacterium sp.]|nr:hypothetical protein [Draconibacterium sp.]
MCWRSEDTIVTNLIARDTTGIAHLAYNTIKLQDGFILEGKCHPRFDEKTFG